MSDPPEPQSEDAAVRWTLSPLLRVGFLVTAAINVVAVTGWTVWLVATRDRGLDVTDEGYYLSAVEYPWSFPHAPTDFAFVLRPFWLITGGDLALFRLFGVAMVLGCALSLGLAAARWFDPTAKIDKFAVTVLCVAATCVASLSAVDLGLVTPNYNSVSASLVMLLLAILAKSLGPQRGSSPIDSVSERRRKLLLDSATGLICYMLLIVKFTAGVSAGVILLAVVVHRVRTQNYLLRTLAPFAVGAGVGLLIHGALVGGRLPARIGQWRTAADLSQLRRDHPLDQLLQRDFISDEAFTLSLQLAALLVALLALRRLRSRGRAVELIAAIAVVVLVALLSLDLPTGLDAPTGLWWLRLAVAIMAVSLIVTPEFGSSAFIGIGVLGLVLGSAFGSNNGFIAQSHFFGGALVGGALLVVARVDLRVTPSAQLVRLAPLLACTLVLPLGVHQAMSDGREMPYRLEGPRGDAEALIESRQLGTLRVHSDIADLASWLEQVSREWSAEPSCVVNLEGRTPMVEVLLGIAPAGSNWDIGRYPGSKEATWSALEREDCWQSSRFLLVSSPDALFRIATPDKIAARCEPPRWILDWNGATGRRLLHISECLGP
jgi:hypothetical protein